MTITETNIADVAEIIAAAERHSFTDHGDLRLYRIETKGERLFIAGSGETVLEVVTRL